MPDSPETRAAQLIAQVWQRSRPQVLTRLAELENAAAAAAAGTLDEAQRAQAESTAHKLSGSLGMFGFPRGTDLARTLEAELKLSPPDAEKLTASLRSELFPTAS
jgi:HPt (histidine-containing phosphotransfer) domain-containing protein